MKSLGAIARALGALAVLSALAAPPAFARDHDRHHRREHHHGHHRRGWDGPRAHYYRYDQPRYYYEPRREYYYDGPRVYVPPPPVPSFGLNLIFPIH
jgi:hypothetical protein